GHPGRRGHRQRDRGRARRLRDHHHGGAGHAGPALRARPGGPRNPAVMSAVVSALHVLALALGLPAVFFRGRALKGLLDDAGLRGLFAADSVWGVAALLWLATGLLRAFGGLEKGAHFYLASSLFWTKMALFVAVVALEIWPMTTFIRW